VEEIIAVMHAAGDGGHGRRLRGLIVILWRAGLRIHEALALVEADLDQRRGAVLVRRGKGGRRREVGMDAYDEWRFVPDEFLEHEETIVVLGHAEARRGDRSLKLPVVAVWRFENEQPRRAQTLTDTLAAARFLDIV
jgi:integrase